MSSLSSLFHRWFGRGGRMVLFPLLIAVLAGREILYFGVPQRPWGKRIFLAGLIMGLFSWWRMDRADARHLASEERRAVEDPKHLFNNDMGLRYNPGHRKALALSMILMGMALLFLAFEVRFWGFLFLGAALCIAGSILLVLF